MKNKVLLLPLLALAACGGSNQSPDKNVLMHNDFESLAGWLPDASGLAKEQAHSGQYSIKVEQGREYSLTYTTALGQLSSTRLRGVRMEAWAYLPDQDAKARVGFLVKDPADGKVLLGEGLDVHEQVKSYGKWTKISKEFTLPATASYTSQLVIFLWGPGVTKPIYLDDIQLTALQ